MYGDALCHVFDAGIRGYSAARYRELEIIADAPFAGGGLCADVDKSIQEQHRLPMQHECFGGQADHRLQVF
jgi:hypothetical protein